MVPRFNMDKKMLVEAFRTRAQPLASAECFCPKCRSEAADDLWKICNVEMTQEGFPLHESSNPSRVFAGDVIHELKSRFDACGNVSGSSWAAKIDGQSYCQ